MQTITYIDECFNENKLTRWPDNFMPLKIYISPFKWYKSEGRADEYKYTQMLIDGFNFWEKNSSGLVSFERVNSLYDSQININWARVDRKSLGSCTFNYDKIGRYYSADIQIGLSDGILHHQYMDENEVYHTILHEIGHSVGLGHSKTKGDIMYVPHQYGTVNVSNNDLLTLKWLYRLPVGKTKQEILSTFNLSNFTSIDMAIKKLSDEDKKSDFEKTKDELLNNQIPVKDLSVETQNIGDLKKYLMHVNNIKIDFKNLK